MCLNLLSPSYLPIAFPLGQAISLENVPQAHYDKPFTYQVQNCWLEAKTREICNIILVFTALAQEECAEVNLVLVIGMQAYKKHNISKLWPLYFTYC